MCGITGLLEHQATHDASRTVRAMADTMTRRGPDGAGIWVEERAYNTIAFGHRRLSILDLREVAAQPMISANERWVITFNGEIYNFRELRARVGKLRTTSDTEVLLELIAQDGVRATLPRLNGMFAFAAWDRHEQELWIARDRIGIKPLFWTQQGEVFAFGSQLNALRQHPGLRFDVSPASLTAFLRDGYVPAPNAIFSDVHKLRPGHFLRVRPGRGATTECYWDLRDIALRGLDRPLGADDLVSELEDTLRDAVRLRMIADVPLGAFLSGGIDSSLITALMQEQSDRPVQTFSIGFEEASHDEAPFARAVADHIGTDHTELYVTGDEALALIDDLPHWYDEPFSDASQLPTYLVSQLARQSVTVALSGDGGDELFHGYERYFVLNKLARGFVGPRRLRAAVSRLLQAAPGSPRLDRVAEALMLKDRAAFYRWMTSVHRNPQTLVRADAMDEQELDLPLDRIDELSKQMQLIDEWRYLHDDILTKVDRASMAVSLEVRVPILDHRVIELSWRAQTATNMRHDQGKWPLRELLYRRVPRELLERPKKGFNVPIAAWLRGPLRDWAEDLLSEDSLRQVELLEVPAVRNLWTQHLAGQANHEGPLWALLTFLSWSR